MCNLQSNLKLNERERAETEDRRERRANERAEERRGEGGQESARGRVLGIYTLAKYQDLSLSLSLKISSRTACTEGGGGAKGETAQCARGSRDIVALPPCRCIPSQTALEATEILEAPLCFWLLERVKIPSCKTLSERKGR